VDHEGVPPAGWTIEQVLALAPRPTSIGVAMPLAVPARWSGLGCDHQAVWGRCTGTAREPYDTIVHHTEVAFRCSCPSRVTPCKHALALLIVWVNGRVPHADGPAAVRSWLASRPAVPESADTATGQPRPTEEPAPTAVAPEPPVDRGTERDDRLARMAAGLTELDRWIEDRLRTGLADPALAEYATWDALAARLVDAQVGGLANRVRRLAGVVGAFPQWHEHLLAELGVLHLLAQAGSRTGALPPHLADSVATTVGWQVRQADVLAGVPHTEHWMVLGRSDTREDRIEVRRTWLRAPSDGRWAMSLSFAAYGQSLDASLSVGTSMHADLYRYPGVLGLRSAVAVRHAEPEPLDADIVAGWALTLAGACQQVGEALVAEPWLERFPCTVRAALVQAGAGRWALADHTGSLPLVGQVPGLALMLALSGGQPMVMTCEWTPLGMLPLAVHDTRFGTYDVGPRVDPTFAAEVA
jgi:hypothetical protein